MSQNFIKLELDSSVSVVDTVFTIKNDVGQADALDNPAAGYYPLTVWNQAQISPVDDPNREQVLVVSKTSNQITVRRAYGGTTAFAHAAGATVALTASAEFLHLFGRESKDIRGYGAAIDGSANADQAFQDAFDDIGAGKAGIIEIPASAIVKVTTVAIPNDRFVKIRGVGRARIFSTGAISGRIEQDDAATGDVISIDSGVDTSSYFNHELEGLQVLGGAAGRHGVSMRRRVRACKLRDVWVQLDDANARGSGVYSDECYYLEVSRLWCGGEGGRYGFQAFRNSNLRLFSQANFGAGGPTNNVTKSHLYLHGGVIGSATAAGTTVTVTIPGGHPFSPGDSVKIHSAYDVSGTGDITARTEYEGTWTVDSIAGDDFVVTVSSPPPTDANIVAYRPGIDYFGGLCDIRNYKVNSPGDEHAIYLRAIKGVRLYNCSYENSSGITPISAYRIEDCEDLDLDHFGGDEPDPSSSGKPTLEIVNSRRIRVLSGNWRGLVKDDATSEGTVLRALHFEGNGTYQLNGLGSTVDGCFFENKGRREMWTPEWAKYEFVLDGLTGANDAMLEIAYAHMATPLIFFPRAISKGAPIRVTAQVVEGSIPIGETIEVRPAPVSGGASLGKPEVVLDDANVRGQMHVTQGVAGYYEQDDRILLEAQSSVAMPSVKIHAEVFVRYTGAPLATSFSQG